MAPPSILVDKESYLLELARYLVLNPVRARIVAGPAGWEWSSYRAMAGEGPVPSFLTTDWLLAQFGGQREESQAAYRRFVAEGMGKTVREDLKGGVILGSRKVISQDLTPMISIPARHPSPA